MERKELHELYDNEYAASYDDTYLHGQSYRECTEFEVSLIGDLIKGTTTWLDVACGTGYFLSRFPGIPRAGLDISPAMLDMARRQNPGVPFYEDDFRNERPEWRDCWDLVSCMWYAYSYAGSMTDIEVLVRNLASWTSANGICFLPVCDPNVLCKTMIPYRPDPDSSEGRLLITAVVWTWVDEPSGRVHPNLVAPHPEHLIAMFGKYFADVTLMKYPQFQSDYLGARMALIARKKLPSAD